MHLNMTIPTCH